MEQESAKLDILDEFDGYMIRDTSANSSFLYLTDFEIDDPVVYLKTSEKELLLVPPLELSRARKEASVDEVVNMARYTEGHPGRSDEAQIKIIKGFLKENKIDKLAVPGDFPFRYAHEIGEAFEIKPVEDFVKQKRRIKTKEEIRKIKESQKNTEEAMKHVEDILNGSEVRDSILFYRDEVLTSERLRNIIQEFLIDKNCKVPIESIAASGKESSDPHSNGKGPIKANQPIIVDIFPRKNRYFGDMTRTFVKGEASEKLKEMHEAVEEALIQALDEVGDGTTTDEVHGKACDVLEERGFDTLRKDKDIEEGFLHSTGHGVGLDLHESPRIAENGEQIQKGMVMTIEPGLYIKDVGGVRLEDMIVVEESGYRNLNSMSYEM